MRPCAAVDCPALATRGEYCPVHAARTEAPCAEALAQVAEAVESDERRKAREIGKLYSGRGGEL